MISPMKVCIDYNVVFLTFCIFQPEQPSLNMMDPGLNIKLEPQEVDEAESGEIPLDKNNTGSVAMETHDAKCQDVKDQLYQIIIR